MTDTVIASSTAYTVLVTKRFAERSMLAMTRRPSATTPGSVENSPFKSTSCATARRRRGTGAHGHTDVGVLQRQRVVDAVAGHRDHVTLRLERADHGALLLRRDPAEHPVLLEHLRHLVLVLGKLAGVVAAARVVEADTRGDRGDGPRVVARDHPQLHSLRGEVGEGLRRVGPHLLGEHHQRHRREVGGQRLVRERRVAVREHEGAPSARRELVGRAPGPATRCR